MPNDEGFSNHRSIFTVFTVQTERLPLLTIKYCSPGTRVRLRNSHCRHSEPLHLPQADRVASNNMKRISSYQSAITRNDGFHTQMRTGKGKKIRLKKKHIVQIASRRKMGRSGESWLRMLHTIFSASAEETPSSLTSRMSHQKRSSS